MALEAGRKVLAIQEGLNMDEKQEKLRWAYLQIQIAILQARDHLARLEKVAATFPDEIKQVPKDETHP